MRWFELFFLLIVGILFFCLGWEIWKKEKISLIHDYHHKKVKDSDKKAYTTIDCEGDYAVYTTDRDNDIAKTDFGKAKKVKVSLPASSVVTVVYEAK